MGHQLAGAVVAGAVAGLLAAACSAGTQDDGLPAVLDNARDQVAAVTAPLESESVSDEVGELDDQVAELPPPDPSTFGGSNRVVNLWVDADGEMRDIDVWARRTFVSGPYLLATELGFGERSAYFGTPPGHELAIVAAGAGPDGEELGTVFEAIGDEQLTAVFTNDGRGSDTLTFWERGAEQAPDPPADGSGLVVVAAVNTRAFADELLASVGSDSYAVGLGGDGCAPQRAELEGFEANVLGGGQRVELELAPGPATITMHPWFPSAECEQPAVHEVVVDVTPGSTQLVLVFTLTGTELDAVVVPVR